MLHLGILTFSLSLRPCFECYKLLLYPLYLHLSEQCDLSDIVFVVDSSGSIKLPNWLKILNFVRTMVAGLNIGPFDTHVGMITYGTRAHDKFFLNTFNSSQKMQAFININNMPWLDQETNTSGGIWNMRQQFSAVHGDRPRAPNLGIVLTDGASNRGAHLTIPFAKEAHNAGITMISIGVGDKVNQTELQAIASNPKLAFNVSDFTGLHVIKDQLVSVACDIPVGKSLHHTHC